MSLHQVEQSSVAPRRTPGVIGRWWPRMPQIITMLGGLIGLVIALAGANMLGFQLRPSTLFRLDVGFWGDQDLLRGVYNQEQDGAGITYRWTQAESAFFVRDFAAVRHPDLRIAIGGLPQSAGESRLVNFTLDQTPLAVPVMPTPRQYHVLLPTNALIDGDLDVQMRTEASVDPPDRRPVGLRLDDIVLGWTADPWTLPTLPMLLVQAATVLVWLGIAWRIEVPRWTWPLVLVGGVALMSVMTSYRLMVAMAWETRLLTTSTLLLGLVWRAYDWLDRFFPQLGTRREVRWLVWLTVFAIAVRLVAIFYPPWASHDLYIHKQRLNDLTLGWVQLFDTPSEFAGRKTIVPPAFYVIALPFTPLTNDPGVAPQGLYAFLEGTSPLLIVIVVRQLGGSFRAGLLAAFVIALMPIQMTILWWGFGPQVLSQWLLLLLLVFMTRTPSDQIGFWSIASLILIISFTAHNGAVILGGPALAGYLALRWLRQREARRQWRGWGAVLLVSSVIAVLLVYGEVIASQLANLGSGASNVEPTAAEDAARVGRVWGGLRSSFRPLDFALPSVLAFVLPTISLIALIRWSKAEYRWLVVAWIGSAVLFLLVDVVLGLQVRYAYFVIPMLCAGVGLVLDWLMRQRVWGKAVSVAIVALVCFWGLQIWYSGVSLGIKPTLTALTH